MEVNPYKDAIQISVKIFEKLDFSSGALLLNKTKFVITSFFYPKEIKTILVFHLLNS